MRFFLEGTISPLFAIHGLWIAVSPVVAIHSKMTGMGVGEILRIPRLASPLYTLARVL
jgi:hypothetical protein